MSGYKMPTNSIYTKDFLKNKKYIIGNYTYGKPIVHDWGDGGNLVIGKYTSIADGVNILLGGNHRLDWITSYPFHSLSVDLQGMWPEARNIEGDRWAKGDVVIGNDVWIGLNVTIVSGVTIGSGAAVAAGSVVVKDIPPYAIVAGNPAKIIKMRFAEDQIEELIKLEWWNWTDEKVRKNMSILCSPNTDGLFPRHTAKVKVIKHIKKILPQGVTRILKKTGL